MAINFTQPAASIQSGPTSADIARQLAMAQQLQDQGLSGKPVYGGWQGAIGPIVQAIGGAYLGQQASDAQAAEQKSYASTLAQAANAGATAKPWVSPDTFQGNNGQTIDAGTIAPGTTGTAQMAAILGANPQTAGLGANMAMAEAGRTQDFAEKLALADKEAKLKASQPVKMGEGDVLLDPITHKPIYSAPNKPVGQDKWQILTDPTQKDADGNPVQYRYNPVTSQATTLDNKPFAPGGAAKMGGGETGNPLGEETLDRMARQYLTGDKTVLSGLGMGNTGAANRAALQDRITKVGVEMRLPPEAISAKISEYQGLTAANRTLGNRMANIEMAATEFQQMAPLGLTASANVDRTRFPSLNSVLLAVEKGTGDENATRLAVATNSLVNIYARAINPNGTPTDSDKSHARAILDQAYAKGQYAAGVDQMQQEIAAARKAPGAVRAELRDAITGKPNAAMGNGPMPATGSPVRVMTPDDYANVPPGSQYIDPQGNLRTKGQK